MIERNTLLLFLSTIVNIGLTIALVFTCTSGQQKKIASEEMPAEISFLIEDEITEDILSQEELKISEDDNAISSGTNTASALQQNRGVSFTASRAPDSLSGIRGRVNTGEINPINYENPDINVLRQMGAEQYLIHFFTGEQFFKSGNFDRAINEYTTDINLHPGFTEGFISRGNSHLKKRDYTRAIEDFTRVINSGSNKAEIYNYRGYARAGRGEHSSAIEDFTRAISLNPIYVDALINRSYSFYQLENYQRVIEDCNRILAIEPDNEFILNRRGSAYYNLRQDDLAIADFTEAIRIRGNYAIAYQNRGNAYHSKGEIEKANADFAMAQSFRQVVQ